MTAPWATQVSELARRIGGPVLADALSVDLLPVEPGQRRTYRYECTGGRLRIEASDANAACVGLHAYVKRYCNRRVCWDAVLPLELPIPLPSASSVTSPARSADSYYLNFCASSYSTAYWDWARWEREIDWMALHGITMPLALTGHEAVLYRVYRELGMSDTDVRAFLGGPGYLPFQFMGNLDHFGGALPPDWIEKHRRLGGRILDRERELGMRPVLPGFAGHVPAELGLQGTTTRVWEGFVTQLLDPSTPDFAEIAARTASAQQDLFGTDHHYAIDPFIEMPPDGLDSGALGRFARRTFDALVAADPEAVWVIQSWPFSYNRSYWTSERVDGLLDAVPVGRLLVLDLFAERRPMWSRPGGFNDHQWQWCVLHNFGGNTGLFGNLDGLQAGAEAAFASSRPPAGLGLTMEAVGTNPVVYELAADLAWAPVGDLETWLQHYVRSRYGIESADAQRAWDLLRRNVYCQQTDEPARHALHRIPSRFADLASRSPDPDPERLRPAHDLLRRVGEANPGLLDRELGADLTAVAVELANRRLDALAAQISSAYEREDLAGFSRAAEEFLRTVDELDELLSDRPDWQLETFREAALSWATDAEAEQTLRDNADRIVSVWADDPLGPLADYGARTWGGLLGSYYRPRWELWLAELRRSLLTGVEIDIESFEIRVVALTERFLSG